MKKIVITGAKGQLGRQFSKDFLSSSYEVYSLGKNEMNVVNYEEVCSVLEELSPSIIIHCAAYTKVDLAEINKDEVFFVNATGTRNIAIAAEKIKAKLIYISTDYVFNGRKGTEYNEFDPPSPINVYGASKYVGENFVQEFHTRYFIIRTSWLYGKYGKNFVETMLNLAKVNRSIRIVNDQYGSPTYAKDLVNCVRRLMGTDLYGIYHVSNEGVCSRYEFAKKIFSLANIDIQVIPVSADEFKTMASRPTYSALQHTMLQLHDICYMRSWEEALKDYIEKTTDSVREY
ncbi:dTDP-4-dehydrorhamnose reductase [Bacillus cereus group sp. BfR-BA-01380]|uniref:dTDP-4-dehydrorhamnose reductase n=1 Tax=Bacillus cereus group sp. BfR-BA-01380 TaxID=2920324 RepID=UPI001F5740B8|nr:dTDP-4-dehydrorhamnose reductase [Bacillus cereus group sp. BfR-BA-01380]